MKIKNLIVGLGILLLQMIFAAIIGIAIVNLFILLEVDQSIFSRKDQFIVAVSYTVAGVLISSIVNIKINKRF